MAILVVAPMSVPPAVSSQTCRGHTPSAASHKIKLRCGGTKHGCGRFTAEYQMSGGPPEPQSQLWIRGKSSSLNTPTHSHMDVQRS